MKSTFLLKALGSAALFFSSAQAGSSESWDVATGALEHIQYLTNNLTKSIYAWDGQSLADALENIHYPANATAVYVANATEVLKQYPTVYDITQAFMIGTPAQRLAYSVNASVAALTIREKAFVGASVAPVVLADIQALLVATRGLTKVLLSYIPSDLKPVADKLALQFTDSLQQGYDCYNGEKSQCYTAIVDPNRAYNLAVEYNAMKPDGSPIA